MVKYKNRKGKGLDNHAQKRDRKPYLKPTLTKYGHVEKLTHGATAGAGDGLSSRQPV
jgi:hypothetical protein